jgi:hypothetical protein
LLPKGEGVVIGWLALVYGRVERLSVLSCATGDFENANKKRSLFVRKGPHFFTGGAEAWPPGPDVPESEKELKLRKMFVTVNAAVTNAVEDDIKTANSLVEYAEKKG